MSSEAESLFQRALMSRGEAYLMAESELRDSPGSPAVLREHENDPDPIARLAAGVMLEWAEARDPGFEDARRYLDQLDQRFARTVAGVPPIPAVIENLTNRFAGRLTELLALRLVQRADPGWRVLVTLGYLDRHKNPATTDALIRFASETPEPQLQQLAAHVLARSGDPALAQKIAAERDRLAARGATLPPAVASLAAPSAQLA